MLLAALAAALAASTADPCAPVQPLAAPDLDAAQAYLAVGAREEVQGALDTAASAYREAARREGESGAARQALGRLCQRVTAARKFDEGLAALREGRRPIVIVAPHG